MATDSKFELLDKDRFHKALTRNVSRENLRDLSNEPKVNYDTLLSFYVARPPNLPYLSSMAAKEICSRLGCETLESFYNKAPDRTPAERPETVDHEEQDLPSESAEVVVDTAQDDKLINADTVDLNPEIQPAQHTKPTDLAANPLPKIKIEKPRRVLGNIVNRILASQSMDTGDLAVQLHQFQNHIAPEKRLTFSALGLNNFLRSEKDTIPGRQLRNLILAYYGASDIEKLEALAQKVEKDPYSFDAPTVPITFADIPPIVTDTIVSDRRVAAGDKAPDIIAKGNMNEVIENDLQEATEAAVALGVPVEIAKYGTQVALEAAGQKTRYYHNASHFSDVLNGSKSIDSKLIRMGISSNLASQMAGVYAIASRDHDTVYTNADNGMIPPHINRGIGEYIEKTVDGKYSIIDADSAKRLSSDQQFNLKLVLETFEFEPGQTLNKFRGQDEFLSALHSLEVNPNVTSQLKIALAAIHYSTIPFEKPDSLTELASRIEKITVNDNPILTSQEVAAICLTSADFANRDVRKFAGARDDFQADTMKLLQEAGANLNEPDSLVTPANNMAAFFKRLQPDLTNTTKVVFRNFTFNNRKGEKVSLLSDKELSDLNSAANDQITRLIEFLKTFASRPNSILPSAERVLEPRKERVYRKGS